MSLSKKRMCGTIEFFLICIFNLLSILEFDSVYMLEYGFSYSAIIDWLWQLILLLLVVYLHFQFRISIPFKIVLFSILYIIISSLFMLFEYFRYNYSYIYFLQICIDPIIIILLFYILHKIGHLHFFFCNYEYIVLLISIISLLFWVCSLINIPTNNSISLIHGLNIINIPGYFGLDYIAQKSVNILGLNLIRNTGLFVEAPFYANVLLFALFIELFIRNNNRINWRLIILFITIISTTSTNGISILFFALIYFMFINNRHKNFMKFILFLAFFIFGLIFLYFILSEKINTVSYNVRSNEFNITFKAFKSHIFLGNGIGNIYPVSQYVDPSLTGYNSLNYSLSTGFMTILVYGGLALESLYIIPIIFIIFNFNKSKSLFGLSLFTLILFILEDISMGYITIVIISYLWFNILRGKLKYNR